ncbi:MAG: hypothetical protein LBP76_02525 [Treponema sp.]|nr:hypothetical protein [Treponema sp.]
MEKIKNVCQEIEMVLLYICSKGINEIDCTFLVEKLEDLIFKANNLNMKTGEYLLSEFIIKNKKYKEGEIGIKEMAKSLMALDFYSKNIIYYEDQSEL